MDSSEADTPTTSAHMAPVTESADPDSSEESDDDELSRLEPGDRRSAPRRRCPAGEGELEGESGSRSPDIGKQKLSTEVEFH